jgi:hypothetical protein
MFFLQSSVSLVSRHRRTESMPDSLQKMNESAADEANRDRRSGYLSDGRDGSGELMEDVEATDISKDRLAVCGKKHLYS